MKFEEKKKYLIENHRDEYVKKYREEENNLNEQTPLVCLCGRLATGLHTSRCSKFRDRVERNTVKALAHLIK